MLEVCSERRRESIYTSRSGANLAPCYRPKPCQICLYRSGTTQWAAELYSILNWRRSGWCLHRITAIVTRESQRWGQLACSGYVWDGNTSLNHAVFSHWSNWYNHKPCCYAVFGHWSNWLPFRTFIVDTVLFAFKSNTVHWNMAASVWAHSIADCTERSIQDSSENGWQRAMYLLDFSKNASEETVIQTVVREAIDLAKLVISLHEKLEWKEEKTQSEILLNGPCWSSFAYLCKKCMYKTPNVACFPPGYYSPMLNVQLGNTLKNSMSKDTQSRELCSKMPMLYSSHAHTRISKPGKKNSWKCSTQIH